MTLNLKIPFGGSDARAEERSKLAARIGHMKAVRGLGNARRELEIEVRKAVEAVRSRARRMRLAGEALELARKTAGIEEGRLRRGLTSSYRMGQIRTDLASAATAELNARIDYLNAVTALERVEGTVLERWGIVVDDGTAEAVMGTAGRRGRTERRPSRGACPGESAAGGGAGGARSVRSCPDAEAGGGAGQTAERGRRKRGTPDRGAVKGGGGRQENEPVGAGGGSGAHVVERMLASMKGGVLVVSRGGRIRTWNGAATRILGRSAPPEAGAGFGGTVLPAEGLDSLSRTVLEAVSGTGALGWTRGRQEGGRRGSVAAQRKRERARAAQGTRRPGGELKEATGRMQGIVLDSIEDGVIAVSREGRITTFNEAAARILGIEAGDAVGRLVAETFVEHEGLDDFTQALLDGVAQGGPLGRRAVQAEIGGRTRQLTVVTSRLQGGEDGARRGGGIVTVFSDVTQAHALRAKEAALARRVEAQNEELRAAYRTLEERNRALVGARRGARATRVTAVAVALALVAGAVLLGLRPAPETAPEGGRQGEAGAGTATVTVTPQRLRTTVVIPGRLAAGAETEVASRLDGVVKRIRFAYGEEVKHGQVLIELDVSERMREYRAMQAEAIDSARHLGEVERWATSPAMEAARRAVAQARRAVERQREEVAETRFLLDEGIIAAVEHERAMEELGALEGAQRAAIQALEEARKRGDARAVRAARLAHHNLEEELKAMETALMGATVVAPAAGIVTEATGRGGTDGGAGGGGPVTVGDQVVQGQRLLSVVDVRRLSVAAVVDETEIVKLRAGQPVTVTSDAFPGLALAGEIATVSAQAAGGARAARAAARFEVTARLAEVGPEAGERLRLGMSVDMRVVTRDEAGALMVPLEAVRRSRGGLEVLVREAGGAVRAQAVETGTTTAGKVEITAGLAEGEEIVMGPAPGAEGP